MKKVYVLAALMAALIIFVISVWLLLPSPQKYSESFENGMGTWIADADVPEDPNNPGQPVEWRIRRVENPSHSGRFSLELFIDGRQDDGTIWIETKIESGRRSQVKVSFWFYSEEPSFNTLAVICTYIGAENPEVEDDFYVLGPANEVAGWKKYEYSAVIDSSQSGEVWVAVGISVRFETYLTYYLDDVEIIIS